MRYPPVVGLHSRLQEHIHVFTCQNSYWDSQCYALHKVKLHLTCPTRPTDRSLLWESVYFLTLLYNHPDSASLVAHLRNAWGIPAWNMARQSMMLFLFSKSPFTESFKETHFWVHSESFFGWIIFDVFPFNSLENVDDFSEKGKLWNLKWGWKKKKNAIFLDQWPLHLFAPVIKSMNNISNRTSTLYNKHSQLTPWVLVSVCWVELMVLSPSFPRIVEAVSGNDWKHRRTTKKLVKIKNGYSKDAAHLSVNSAWQLPLVTWMRPLCDSSAQKGSEHSWQIAEEAMREEEGSSLCSLVNSRLNHLAWQNDSYLGAYDWGVGSVLLKVP